MLLLWNDEKWKEVDFDEDLQGVRPNVILIKEREMREWMAKEKVDAEAVIKHLVKNVGTHICDEGYVIVLTELGDAVWIYDFDFAVK